MKIKRICEECGKEFEVFPYLVKHGHGRFCSRKCQGKWQSKYRKGKEASNWQGGKIKCICLTCGKEFMVKKAYILKKRGKYCSVKCYYIAKEDKTEVVCKQCGKKFKTYPSEIQRGHGKFCSVKCSSKWQMENTDKIKKMRKGNIQKPTKPELIFEGICQKNNLDFHYVGDGQLWIGKRKKLNPDFIEANGKKICIEIMGAYWHSRLLNQKLREDALMPYREKHYKKYKWMPIFIWDTDLLRKDAEQFVLSELKKEGVI